MLTRHIKLSKLDRRGCFVANTVHETCQEDLFGEELLRFQQLWLAELEVFLGERFSAEQAKEIAYRCFIEFEGTLVMYKLDRQEAHLHNFKERTIRQLSDQKTAI